MRLTEFHLSLITISYCNAVQTVFYSDKMLRLASLYIYFLQTLLLLNDLIFNDHNRSMQARTNYTL